MKKLAVLILVLLVAGGGWWWWQQHKTQAAEEAAKAAPKNQAVLVSTARVMQQDVPRQIKLVGTVFANATVAVKSRIDSQVMAVHFSDGDKVERGAALFTLDDRALKAQRAELLANIQRDTVQLKNAKTQYERSAKLSAQGFVTSEKIDQDKTAYEAQQAGLVATRATLENLDIQMDYAIIRAPISGRAGTIAVTAGNNVKANDTGALVTINQIDPILVQFSIPQRYYDALRAAMAHGKIAVTAVRSESGATLNGALEYIDNNIDLTTGTFVARARFDNPEEKLWPGMFVDVSITLDTLQGALVVPAAAIQGSESDGFVYVVDAESKARRRPVTILMRLDNDVVLKDGVAKDEQVVTDGLLRLTDGAAVQTDERKSAAP